MDLKKVCKTYGKTIHFWQVDRAHNLSFRLPQVMRALTRDSQLYEGLDEVIDLWQNCEKKCGESFKKEREKRVDVAGAKARNPSTYECSRGRGHDRAEGLRLTLSRMAMGSACCTSRTPFFF
ncbi:hypothetical protein MLD38_038429 [Melastoma candidum]|uniref:Uncharacterized protein n=1 Tax=Melastoma candidum TaxID=119954 RepID=A0ACB9KZ38_9MYRT|nr:hypothetical protein MLD38_038429 [Melastoma candidum]